MTPKPLSYDTIQAAERRLAALGLRGDVGQLAAKRVLMDGDLLIVQDETKWQDTPWDPIIRDMRFVKGTA